MQIVRPPEVQIWQLTEIKDADCWVEVTANPLNKDFFGDVNYLSAFKEYQGTGNVLGTTLHSGRRCAQHNQRCINLESLQMGMPALVGVVPLLVSDRTVPGCTSPWNQHKGVLAHIGLVPLLMRDRMAPTPKSALVEGDHVLELSPFDGSQGGWAHNRSLIADFVPLSYKGEVGHFGSSWILIFYCCLWYFTYPVCIYKKNKDAQDSTCIQKWALSCSNIPIF